EPSRWRHGYALARQTGLKSGTLYPILIRLADRGLVEARWQDEPQPGRPRRHLYRLNADGLASATAPLGRRARPGRRAAARAAGGGAIAERAPRRGARRAMTRLSRGCAAAGRAAARLLPAERREWAEALWAEAHQVPPGLPRLAWRAGGLRLIAREATMARRL